MGDTTGSDGSAKSTGVFDKLSTLEKIIGLVAAAAVAWSTISAEIAKARFAGATVEMEQLKKQLDVQKEKDELRWAELQKQQALALAEAGAKREQTKFDQELTTRVIDKIEQTLDGSGTPDVRLRKLEAILVLSYGLTDERQRNGIGDVIGRAIAQLPAGQRDGGVDTQRVAAASFDAQQLADSGRRGAMAATPRPAADPAAVKAAPAVAWSNYDFDIFYCAGGPDEAQMREHANEILRLRSADAKASGRWRLRPLPALVNQRPGYGVQGIEIRYSSSDELAIATALKARIEQTLKGAQPVTMQPSSQETKWYLSVFVCSGAA